MEKRAVTCCFTGHRELSNEDLKVISKRLDKEISLMIFKGCHRFVAGGALGFDTLVALKILDLKRKGFNIQLIVVAPFANQTKGWSQSDLYTYEAIRNGADDYILLRAGYQRGCYQERNQYMVDLSSYCLGYCTNSKSGSAQTLRYAEKEGLQVINIADLNYQTTLY